VATDSAGDSVCPPRPVSERNERYAALIKADRTVILTSYARSLEELQSHVTERPRFREQVVGKASEVISDIVESVLAAEVRVDRRVSAAWVIDRAGAENYLSPLDRLRAADAFFKVAMASLASHVRDDQGFLPCFKIAVLALNESVSRRMRDCFAVDTGSLLNPVHRAQVDERRRIARDLHDRLGEMLSVGLRQLDLQEIAGREDPVSQAGIAREVLTEAMRRLRLVTSDLREEPVRSLEKALIRYLDSGGADADVRLQVSGDETWAPPVVHDEVFLIIREAVHNALVHGAPRLVMIGVDLTPFELRAWVEDDGRGFVPKQRTDPAFAGTGLTSMRERAALIGGRLTVSSAPGHGTRVELIVSLPGHHDERSG
jgi:signal transduction histidine kinase